MEAISIYEGKVSRIRVSYVNEVPTSQRIKITSSDAIATMIRQQYENDNISIDHREAMFCVYLNRKNQVLAVSLISLGGIVGTVCDIKIILQEALAVNASALILIHNHPSGNTKPSFLDLKETEKIGKGCEMVGLELLDHVIVTTESNYSFADNGEKLK